MAIKGSLREASLPDVLQLLAMGKKTGCLSVNAQPTFGYVYFDRGRISFASVVNRRDRIGDVLLKSGVITREQLDAAIALQGTRRERRLGELLVELGAITRDVLHGQVTIQIEEAVYFLFTCTQGTFSFEPDVLPDQQDFLVSINPESLLLEGARRVDEWSVIEKKIPSFDLVFELDRAKLQQAGSDLTADQRGIAQLVDGRRDVLAIIEESGMVEFEVAKTLYGLLTAGIIYRVGKSRPSAADPQDEQKVQEHRNLGIAFYRTGMFDESLRELRRVQELRPGDPLARFYSALVFLRSDRPQEAASVLEALAGQGTSKPAVWHNLGLALERLGRTDDAHGAYEEAMRRGGETDPLLRLSRGILALRRGDAAAADAEFQAAREHFGRRPPSAAWFHYAALAAGLLGDAPRAEELLLAGVQLHPKAGLLHADLAAVQERLGKHDLALAAAERAVHEVPHVPQAHKLHGDLLYRAQRFDDALDAYLHALRLAPALGPDLHLRLGNLRVRRQEGREARAHWERALELDPENGPARANLAALAAVP